MFPTRHASRPIRVKSRTTAEPAASGFSLSVLIIFFKTWTTSHIYHSAERTVVGLESYELRVDPAMPRKQAITESELT